MLDPHSHNGIDSPPIAESNYQNIPWQYNAKEFNNGSVTGTATIDWRKGNVQYVTLTGDTTFTFINPQPGMRCNLFVAGAFTPTWPSTVHWSGGTTPTATASANHGDEYGFIYRNTEGFYHGFSSLNYATT